VVPDLLYEARDIPQELASTTKIDQWFEAKTKGLNDWQKAALREQWGTMQKVLSSRSRMERVVEDIVFDFGLKPRLVSQRAEGWVLVRERYDDGGVSGGTPERPALKRRVADIQEGLVDVVVVYNIERSPDRWWTSPGWSRCSTRTA